MQGYGIQILFMLSNKELLILYLLGYGLKKIKKYLEISILWPGGIERQPVTLMNARFSKADSEKHRH